MSIQQIEEALVVMYSEITINPKSPQYKYMLGIVQEGVITHVLVIIPPNDPSLMLIVLEDEPNKEKILAKSRAKVDDGMARMIMKLPDELKNQVHVYEPPDPVALAGKLLGTDAEEC